MITSNMLKDLTLLNTLCPCTTTDMDHHRVNVADADSRSAVVLDRDNSSGGPHSFSSLLLKIKKLKRSKNSCKDVVDAADLAVVKEVREDNLLNAVQVVGDSEARNAVQAEAADPNTKM